MGIKDKRNRDIFTFVNRGRKEVNLNERCRPVVQELKSTALQTPYLIISICDVIYFSLCSCRNISHKAAHLYSIKNCILSVTPFLQMP